MTALTRSMLIGALVGALSTAAHSQVAIDQNRALAGTITPGDSPGFPITISVPGHYKLLGKLDVPANTTGIHVTSPDVTLDLNGFAVAGKAECTIASGSIWCNGAVDSVGIQAEARNVVVRNGSVRGFATGLLLRDGLVEKFSATDNTGTALVLGSKFHEHLAVLGRDLVVRRNNNGIELTCSSIENAVVVMNVHGVQGQMCHLTDSMVVNSMIVNNKGYGLRGVHAHTTLSKGNNIDTMGVTSMGGNVSGAGKY